MEAESRCPRGISTTDPLKLQMMASATKSSPHCRVKLTGLTDHFRDRPFAGRHARKQCLTSRLTASLHGVPIEHLQVGYAVRIMEIACLGVANCASAVDFFNGETS